MTWDMFKRALEHGLNWVIGRIRQRNEPHEATTKSTTHGRYIVNKSTLSAIQVLGIPSFRKL